MLRPSAENRKFCGKNGLNVADNQIGRTLYAPNISASLDVFPSSYFPSTFSVSSFRE
jgi:hypothetical protein